MSKSTKVINLADARKKREQTIASAQPEAANFKMFMEALNAGSEDTASELLTEILEVSPEVGKKSTRYFIEQTVKDPNTLLQAMELRSVVNDESAMQALEIILKCFGLSGIDALRALTALKKRA